MDYTKYKRTKIEWIKLLLLWIGISGIFSYLFYKNLLFIIFLGPFFVLFERNDRKKKIKRRKNILSEQFVEWMQVVIASLKSGTSLEGAVLCSGKRLEELYGEEALLITELHTIERGMKMNRNIEQLFMELGERSDIAEIRECAEVLSVTKRTGGNLIRVMENTVGFLAEKKEMEEEIKALVSGKKLEGRAMGYFLPGMLFYINLSMPSVSKSLYHNATGIFIMTGILSAYLICLLWFEKVSEIRV